MNDMGWLIFKTYLKKTPSLSLVLVIVLVAIFDDGKRNSLPYNSEWF